MLNSMDTKMTSAVNPSAGGYVFSAFFHPKLPLMKALYPLLLLLVCAFGRTSAQDYFLEVDSADYVPLQNPIVLTDFVWDDPNLTVPFNFPFTFFDSTYTQMSINGDLGLGGLLSPSLDYDLDDEFPLLVPIGDDLIDLGSFDNNGASLSPIGYVVEGDVGNRILKLEWNNAGFFDSDDASNTINLQLWLYESDGSIEYRYGPSAINDFFVYTSGNGPVVGLIGGVSEAVDTLRAAYLLTGDPLAPVIQTSVQVNEVPSLNATIPDGTIYRFSSAPPTSTPAVASGPQLRIYPNPTTDRVQLRQRNMTAISALHLIDTNGRAVGQFPPNTRSLDLSNLPSGIYTLSVQGEQGTSQHRIVKQ